MQPLYLTMWPETQVTVHFYPYDTELTGDKSVALNRSKFVTLTGCMYFSEVRLPALHALLSTRSQLKYVLNK